MITTSTGTSDPVLAVDDRQDEAFTVALGGRFHVKTKHLKVGDFVWACPLGTVGVEDKCMADLMGSLRNGRLDDELRRLTAAYAVPVLFIRGKAPWGNGYSSVSWDSLEKIKFGRQLHGVFVWQAPDRPTDAATSLRELYDYLAKPRDGGIEGVRREVKHEWKGPLGPRAEVIYGILGAVGGIKGRRAVAERIAEACTLREFLRIRPEGLTWLGFTAHMAEKVHKYLIELEARPSK